MVLESTFQHLSGVGEITEKRLWSLGCTSWDKLISSDYGLSKQSHRRLRAGVFESKVRLADLDHHYFREKLSGDLTWRAFNAFRDHACFLDIETTGLSASKDVVTTVCVHSKRETKSYVAGENLSELGGDLCSFKYIVTFNGARFDLPFLTRNLSLNFHQIHFDLLYAFHRLGLSGGLKCIEKQLGFVRETDGVTGFDAVKLWRAHKRKKSVEVAGRRVESSDALKLLVDYNRDDTVGLEKLAEFVVGRLRQLHSVS